MGPDVENERTTKPDSAASALSAGLGAWLPIETAPKDGSLILVTGCNGSKTVVAAAWKGPSEEDGFDKPRWVGWLGLYELGLAEPKFWHPLPEAPNAVIEGAEGGLPPKAPARMEG